MVQMQTQSGQTVNWTYISDYCEIISEDLNGGRDWEYVAILRGLKRFMEADHMRAIFGSFEVMDRMVRYSCYIGTDRDIKQWGIVQGSGDGEMWDDIRFLIDGKAQPIH
jgi:hypothetical protein